MRFPRPQYCSKLRLPDLDGIKPCLFGANGHLPPGRGKKVSRGEGHSLRAGSRLGKAQLKLHVSPVSDLGYTDIAFQTLAQPTG